MKLSIFFYKELTPAEVGKTGTHEVYVRFPNNFDYEAFFCNSAIQNGSVREVIFEALDLTEGMGREMIPLRFVYFESSNQEKRVPSLAPIFKKRNVEEGDVVCFESRIEEGVPSYFIQFYKKGTIKINPSSIYFIKPDVKKEYAPMSGIKSNISNLQQIYYGAPGTGKSYEINRLTEGKEVIRTTFHPDSDYSTFVGAYKPTSVEIPVRDVTGKVIVENGQKVTENRIVYEFVEQSFLQAYTKAWKAYANAESGTKPTEQYLVIEEINRGNCAQIFGDLFQLLDRNKYGFSDYPITADKDMKKQLAKAFKDLTIANASQINGLYKKDVVSQILSGEILLLPDNLFIWATMNTSDQSLFPIDSAFKRRWDWKYIPISEGRTETGENLGWRIKVAGNEYDWCQFMNKINHEIGEITKSEDKKIGYFFCKAEDGIINAETFVGKVIFYLWNDVFKDQDVANIFSDGDNELKFSDFYDATAEGKTTIKEEKIEVFLKNLGIEPISSQDSKSKDTDGNDEEIADEIAQRQRKESLISIQIPNYPIIYTKESTVVDSFVKALTTIGIDNILPIVDKLKYKRLKCPVISTQKYQTIENGDSGYSYCQAGSLFIIKGCKTYTYIRILEDLNEMLNVGLTLETR